MLREREKRRLMVKLDKGQVTPEQVIAIANEASKADDDDFDLGEMDEAEDLEDEDPAEN